MFNISNFNFSLIHLFSWSGLIDSNILLNDLFQVPNLKTGKMEPLITALTEYEEEQFRNMLKRLHTIFQVIFKRSSESFIANTDRTRSNFIFLNMNAQTAEILDAFPRNPVLSGFSLARALHGSSSNDFCVSSSSLSLAYKMWMWSKFRNARNAGFQTRSRQ